MVSFGDNAGDNVRDKDFEQRYFNSDQEAFVYLDYNKWISKCSLESRSVKHL